MKKGQSLIEILIVIALMAALLPPLFMTLMASRDGKVQQDKRYQAAMFMKETQEAVRMSRENGWSSIATPGIYHSVLSGSTWGLQSGSQSINGFNRQIEIFNVNRLNNEIVSSGGSLDPSTKRIVITVSWNDLLPTFLSSTMYLSRYLENDTYEQTTKTEFDTGTFTNAITTEDSGGEVTLGAGGAGSWCSPSLAIASLDLPKSGVANAVTAIEGRAFTVTGDNASGVSFANITISNVNPPSALVNGTYDGYKTNDVFGDNNYAYLATDDNTKDILIIDIATLPHVERGYFNASGSTNAATIYIRNSVGYMTQGSILRTFDLSSKSGSRPQFDSLTLSGTATEIAVAGKYAYITVRGSSTLLQIVNIENPSNIFTVETFYGSYSPAVDIVINDTQTRAYVALEQSNSYPEFLIFELLNEGGDYGRILGTYNTGSMNPKSLAIVPGNKAIIVGHNGEEYQVINIANESNPTYCGGLEVNSGINGIASILEADGDAYSYIITRDMDSEFKIIEGGPGGNYSDSGVYESETFDLGYSIAFNRIIPTYTEPLNTTVQLQIAIVDAVSGSCSGSTYVFTGPDGTTNTFYTGTEPIFFNDDDIGYENPGRCIKYRVYLETTESNSTPIFEDVTINYSL